MAFPSNSQFQPILIGNQSLTSTNLVGNTQFPVASFTYDATTLYTALNQNVGVINGEVIYSIC